MTLKKEKGQHSSSKTQSPPSSSDYKSFEDCIDEIDEIILWNRHKWRLSSLAWMDFEDVSQKIRLHIFKKWHLWDQKMPLRPWVARIVSNQIINMVRNHYTIYARPCVTCPHNIGGNYCEIYGEQGSECDLFAKWEAGKKVAHEINNPKSIHSSTNYQSYNGGGEEEDYSERIEDQKTDFINIEERVEEVHAAILNKLNPIQAKLYKILFVNNKTDEEAARLMGYYSKEKGRTPGYKQIKNLKKQIIEIAKGVVYE